MNDPISERIEVNVMVLTYIKSTFKRLCIPVKKQN